MVKGSFVFLSDFMIFLKLLHTHHQNQLTSEM